MAQEKLLIVTHMDQGINQLQTSRLILKNWKQKDIEPFAILNSDPRVWEFLTNILSREETLTSVEKFSPILEHMPLAFLLLSLLAQKVYRFR